MRGEKTLDIQFFNSADLSGKSANVLTRIKMAKAFDNLDAVDNLDLFCVYSNKKAEKSIDKEFEDSAINLRKFYFPYYKNERSRGLVSKIYKVLILNNLLNLIYLICLFKGSDKSIKYFWGWSFDSLIGVTLYSALKNDKVILELDDVNLSKSKISRLIYLEAAKRAQGVTTVSARTKKDLVSYGVDKDKVKVLPNAVDLEEYNSDRDKQEIRQELGLGAKSFIVGYTGHLYGYKGADKLVEAAQKLDHEDLTILITGGLDEDIEKYREKIRSKDLEDVFEVKGYVDRSKVPLYQKASDVLIIPNDNQKNNSDYHTSPVKLREYIFSKNPVIASEISDIGNQFSEQELFFFDPNSSAELAEKINYVKQNGEEAKERSEKAFQRVEGYSWTERALEIIKFLEVQ